MLYIISKVLVQIALRTFYRELEVEGAEHVPDSGPVLIVSNHVNAVIDPLMIGIHFHRPITITAKHSLTTNVFMAIAFRVYGVIPFFCREDKGDQRNLPQNRRSIEICHERLRQGAALIIFPEGKSNSASRMHPFKSAAARIALSFERHRNTTPLTIVPVSLYYEDKNRFRSSVFVRFGPGINVEDWQRQHSDNGARSLTKNIKKRIANLQLASDHAEEVRVLDWAGQMIQAWPASPSWIQNRNRRRRKHQGLKERRNLASKLRSYFDTHADRGDVNYLINEMQSLRKTQRSMGITPENVFHENNSFARKAWKSFHLLLLLSAVFPLVLWGGVNFALPGLVVFLIVLRLTKLPENQSSNIIYSSLVVFPFFFLLLSAAALMTLPLKWAIVFVVSWPVSGAATVFFCDRWTEFKQVVSRLVSFQGQTEIRDDLRRRNCKMVEELNRCTQSQPRSISKSPTVGRVSR